MKQSTKFKLIFLVIFFIMGDVFAIFGSLYEKRTFALEQVIVSQQGEIAIRDAVIKEKDQAISAKEEQYKESIDKIVFNIQRTDTFLNIGGGNGDIEVADFDSVVRILEGTSDFDGYLNSIDNYFDERRDFYNQIPNIWPVFESPYNRITSAFGDRFIPYENFLAVQEHKGIDIASHWQAPIIATADGVVIEHWIYHEKYGRIIVIDHGNGFTTTYGHMAKTFIHEGWEIKKGDVIGLMGSSGLTTGAHLHYEVRQDGVAVNPINFMRSFQVAELDK